MVKFWVRTNGSHDAAKKEAARKAAEKAAREQRKKDDHKSKRSTRRGSLIGLYSFEDSSASARSVESWLRDHDVAAPEVKRPSGVGFVATAGRLVIDSGGSGTGGAIPRGGRTFSYGSGQGQISAGLALINTRRLRIYPLVGLSGSGGGTGDRALEPGDEASAPAESRGWGCAQATVGVGIDLLLSFWLFHVLIGLRAGTGYELFNLQVGSGDAVGTQSGPFFRVVIGGGLGRL